MRLALHARGCGRGRFGGIVNGTGGAVESFYSLIDDLASCPPEERAARERRIREAFEVERAVLALDMSEFSLSVRRNGILAHLCQIRRAQNLAIPLIRERGGEVLKCEADNVLAVFERPRDAVEAAVAINDAIAAARSDPAAGPALTVGIGIDFGRLLLIPGRDAFGDPVNVAHKLGEDIARASEILVTDAVRAGIGDPGALRTEEQLLSISGLQLRAHRVLHGPS